MISKSVYLYCKEDISLIENYEKAVNDKSQSWHCHHRLETELNLTSKELIKTEMYFNRPASELIFLTKSDHRRIHNNKLPDNTKNKIGEANKGKPAWNKGIPHTEEQKIKQSLKMKGKQSWNKGISPSDETKKKLSDSHKGQKNPMYGKQAWNKGMNKEEMEIYKANKRAA